MVLAVLKSRYGRNGGYSEVHSAEVHRCDSSKT